MAESMGQNVERWSYDVFLSFRGEDVRDNFLSHLFANLVKSGINTSGFHSLGYRSEAELIDNVIREIIQRLSSPNLHLPKYVVGIGSRINHVKERMCFDSDDVQIIGIHGMGGIGKTTLAKAAYNEFAQRFEGTSFLENCGEYLKKPEGKVHFQRQLLSDILRENVEGTNMDHAMKTRFRNKRVFLVLDDVENMRQLTSLAIDSSYFGPGSRIIITTRNEHLLKQLKVENIYSPEKLDDGDSIVLISGHAFNTSTPPEGFRLLSEELVKYCGGLPLAMEVLGSFLFGRTTSEWRSTLDLLKQNPDDNIQAKLQISFDALNQKQKDIFLDISCFFIGMDKDYVGYILDGCSLHPNIGLAVLKERSLISFSSDNKVMMHDLLRDMGRHIVRGTSLNNYGGWSRLWDPEHVIDVLTKNSGTDAIEGLSLRGGFDGFKVKAFSNLRKLRLLQLDSVELEGSYTHFPEGLRWLCWDTFPLDSIPTELNLESSAVIDLRYSYLKRLWGDQEVKSTMQNRKRRRDNAKFKETPDFTYLPNLEKLLMEGCTALVRVDKSIGTLHKLVLLNLKGCFNLEDLPLEPYALKSLEILVLSGCWKLKRLEDALGTLTSLKDLYLDHTKLQDLPSSIGNLKNLRRLYLMRCESLFKIPDSINELISLEELDISGSSVKEIPLQSGSLPCLTDFSANRCKFLKHIPSSIGGLESLLRLKLNYTPIETLPMEIGDLHSLLELDLSLCTALKFLPENFGKLEKLARLNLNYCGKLRRLPESFGNLKSLYRLDMVDTFVAELPESFGNLSNLRVLRMGKCFAFSNLTLFSSESDTRFVEVPNWFSNLFSLEELDVRKCRIWGKIPDDLEKLSSMRILNLGYNNFHSLPSSLEGLSDIRELSLKHCRELECVPPLPWKLEKLNLENCLALKIISDLSKLENLRVLNLANCVKVADIPGLEHLTALEELYMGGCNSSCSLAVKKRLSKVSLKRMRNLSLSENRIPDLFSQGPVTYSAQPNRELRSVILAVVAFHPDLMGIEAQILKLGVPLFSQPLHFYGLYGTNDDQLYIYRCSSLHPMVTMLKDGSTLQVTTSENFVGEKMELKMYGFHLCYEGEEDLLFGPQLNDSQELANFSSTFEEGETSNSYTK